MTGNQPATAAVAAPLDLHVHIVGNGRSGSGCWLDLRGGHGLVAKFLLRQLGLAIGMDAPDFDQIYVEHLAAWVKTSSLGAVVILAHDRVYDVSGEPRPPGRGFYVPNDYVLKLARANPQFLAGVSIHPARRDALEELDRCLAEGAVLMKCLPNCHNIDCRLPRYQKFWERMAEAGMPLLAHTGGEHTVPQVKPALADPRVLQLPLECGVNVIAAHCGTRGGLVDPDYFAIFSAMTEEYPNLYGDTSALNLPLRSRHMQDCAREPLASCLVHGSDYPVPVSGLGAFLRGFISWRDYRRCRKLVNPLERDYRLKRALGFGSDHFTRAWNLLAGEPLRRARA